MLVAFLAACAAFETVDFCVIGDSTLKMFVGPIWLQQCARMANASCAFSIEAGGVFKEEIYNGRVYRRSTTLGKSADGACSFLLGDVYTLPMLLQLQQYWRDTRGDSIRCRRLLTNDHHHNADFLAPVRTVQTIQRAALRLREQINAQLPFDDFVYILPTLPADNGTRYSQTRAGVLQTSAVVATMFETIGALQLLSELARERGRYVDNLHLGGVENDKFASAVMQALLERELALCRKRNKL